MLVIFCIHLIDSIIKVKKILFSRGNFVGKNIACSGGCEGKKKGWEEEGEEEGKSMIGMQNHPFVLK